MLGGRIVRAFMRGYPQDFYVREDHLWEVEPAHAGPAEGVKSVAIDVENVAWRDMPQQRPDHPRGKPSVVLQFGNLLGEVLRGTARGQPVCEPLQLRGRHGV